MYKNLFYLSKYIKNKNIKNTKKTNDQNKKESCKNDDNTLQLLLCLP